MHVLGVRARSAAVVRLVCKVVLALLPKSGQHQVTHGVFGIRDTSVGAEADRVLGRETNRQCSSWAGFRLESPIRRLIHDPRRILGPWVQPGDRVADIGCGAGYFSIALARLVGPSGLVLAVDVDSKALERLRRRARRAGLASRLVVKHGPVEALEPERGFDFVLAFWMVHEASDRSKLFANVRAMLKARGRLLVVEPWIHVSRACFEESIRLAVDDGFSVVRRFRIRMSRAALLEKPT